MEINKRGNLFKRDLPRMSSNDNFIKSVQVMGKI